MSRAKVGGTIRNGGARKQYMVKDAAELTTLARGQRVSCTLGKLPQRGRRACITNTDVRVSLALVNKLVEQGRLVERWRGHWTVEYTFAAYNDK